MAGRVAQLTNDRTWGEANPYLSSDLNAFGQTMFVPKVTFTHNVLQGVYSSFRVQQSNRIAIAAQTAPAFLYDYYFRIHITPRPLNLGDITSNQLRDVEVWNAHLSPRQLNSVVTTGDTTGVTLIQPKPAPTVFAPNEFRIYQVEATLNGSPTVDVSYRFNFVGQTSDLKVTGRRIVLFPYKPNFKSQFTETLEWRTDVMRAFSGKEQRRGLMATPRRSFEFDIQVSGDETQYWQNLMWGWQERLFALPVWTDSTRLTANVALGTSVIQCVTTNLSFTPSGILVIYVDEHDNETCEIASFTATSITLKRPVMKAWPKDTHVYPCLFAHLPSEVTTTRHTSNVVSARCAFKTSPDVTSPNIAATTAPTIYDGLEVITVQPDWVNGLGQNLSHNFEEIDYGVGQVRWSRKETNPSKVLPYAWLLRDRNMIAAFRSFIGRQSGQLKTCWVPSWTDDFTVVGNVDSGTLTLMVKDNGFVRLVGVNPANDRIAVRTKAGAVFYRRITAMSLQPDGKTISMQLDTTLGLNLTADDFLTVNMLHRCRFATDKFNLQWHTNTVATINSNFKTVDQ